MHATEIINRSRTTLPALDRRFDELHEQERLVLQRLGIALLLDADDSADLHRLRKIRGDLEAVASAERLLRVAVTPDRAELSYP